MSEAPLPRLGQHEAGLTALLARSAAQPTEEERRNLEVVRRLKAAPMEDRRSYQADGFVAHRHGVESLKAVAGFEGRAFDPTSIADRHDVMLAMSAKDDVVWAVWVVTGTHTGSILGVPATGRPVRLLEFGVWRLVDGKVAEAWFMADEVELGMSLGLLGVGGADRG